MALPRTTIDPIRLFQATNGDLGAVQEFMRRVRFKTSDALYRNAPRNSPLNERHRSRGNPNYALGFNLRMYGNQRGSGFRVTNSVAHADIVENGRRASYREQKFSWTAWGGEIRETNRTRGRQGTKFARRTAERVLRQSAAAS